MQAFVEGGQGALQGFGLPRVLKQEKVLDNGRRQDSAAPTEQAIQELPKKGFGTRRYLTGQCAFERRIEGNSIGAGTPKRGSGVLSIAILWILILMVQIGETIKLDGVG